MFLTNNVEGIVLIDIENHLNLLITASSVKPTCHCITILFVNLAHPSLFFFFKLHKWLVARFQLVFEIKQELEKPYNWEFHSAKIGYFATFCVDHIVKLCFDNFLNNF